MMKKIRPWLERLFGGIPALKKRTLSVTGGVLPVAVPCAAALLLMNLIDTMGRVYSWAEGISAFWSLVGSIVVSPLAACMITYAAANSWEGRRTGMNDAVQLARIRIRQVMITGVAAGLMVWLFHWVASAVGSLIGILPALLGWIPLLGPVISGVVAAIVWLLATLMEFAAHAALALGMLALTADGMSGRPQLERTVSVILGGKPETLNGLILAAGLWVCGMGLFELLVWALPAVAELAACVVPTAVQILSMIAASVIYLTARDRLEGMRFHS